MPTYQTIGADENNLLPPAVRAAIPGSVPVTINLQTLSLADALAYLHDNATRDTGWRRLPFATSGVDGGLYVRRTGRIVRLKVTGLLSQNDTAVTLNETLPAGFRPALPASPPSGATPVHRFFTSTSATNGLGTSASSTSAGVLTNLFAPANTAPANARHADTEFITDEPFPTTLPGSAA